MLPPRFVIERVQTGIAGFLAPGAAQHVLATDFAQPPARGREPLPTRRASGSWPARRPSSSARVLPGLPPSRRAARGDANARRNRRRRVAACPTASAYYGWLRAPAHDDRARRRSEIHERGLAEVARIQTQHARDPRARKGSPRATSPARSARSAREPRFLYPDDRSRARAAARGLPGDHRRRERAAAGAVRASAAGEGAWCERVPAFKEAGAAARATTMLAAARRLEAGHLLRESASHPPSIPKFGMRTLAYHEAIPGHHLQIALAQELQGVPFFRRVVPFTAFIEGWALYAERLAARERLPPDALRPPRRSSSPRNSAPRGWSSTPASTRKRWTREQAIDYMLANTALEDSEVVAEVERYIVMPGQALAYKIGSARDPRLPRARAPRARRPLRSARVPRRRARQRRAAAHAALARRRRLDRGEARLVRGVRVSTPEAAGALLAAEREAAVQLLARAFRDNPLNVAVIGSDDPAVRLRVNAHGLRSLLPTAQAHGRVRVQRAGGELAGVLIAAPPDAFPLPAASFARRLRSSLGQGLRVARRWAERVRGARAAAPARAALVPEHPRCRSPAAAARARTGAARRLARRRRPRRELRLPRDRSPRERRLLRARGLRRPGRDADLLGARVAHAPSAARAAQERARGTRHPHPARRGGERHVRTPSRCDAGARALGDAPLHALRLSAPQRFACSISRRTWTSRPPSSSWRRRTASARPTARSRSSISSCARARRRSICARA